ncbi:tetratricopeptide repeat protein [Altererythrobacter soli]|uniref:Tetratricopeptide repeat protein n=1 Tax=Croceibacterium soli TaxID=1739690 RepID=A0A6I4URT6_9SPHN|nr:tetratricopeptide repeat protein [Croceibacterium soli]MXP41612.1 tetratricopeptide repeat protein [Croceibacterium soli]
MKRLVKFTCVAACAAMLGGCQSFPLTGWMFKGKRPAAEQRTELAGNTAGALEEGRAQLRDGKVSAAVASFRIALLDPATRAEASNGLGVAYARLGRPDLAERYFQGAIMAEPANTKYVANLLRLQQQVMLATRANAFEAAALAHTVNAAEPRREREALAGGRVVRVSRGEVVVQSRGDLGNAPAIAVAYRDATADPAAVPGAPSEGSYPVRIALPE